MIIFYLTKNITASFQNNAAAHDEWNNVFNSLRESLRTASRMCYRDGTLAQEEMHKYFMSGTVTLQMISQWIYDHFRWSFVPIRRLNLFLKCVTVMKLKILLILLLL